MVANGKVRFRSVLRISIKNISVVLLSSAIQSKWNLFVTIYFYNLSVTFIHYMTSSEIISCKECGQKFDTIDALKEHEKSEQEDKELQNKRLWQQLRSMYRT